VSVEGLTSATELDSRVSDGLHIRLLWNQAEGRVWVTVLDTRQNSSFCLEVTPDESPVDVFHHPFAYATHQRIAAGQGGPAPELASAA
jgi:hypothetical protein